jgi:hypothetical protein
VCVCVWVGVCVCVCVCVCVGVCMDACVGVRHTLLLPHALDAPPPSLTSPSSLSCSPLPEDIIEYHCVLARFTNHLLCLMNRGRVFRFIARTFASKKPPG